MKVFKNLENRKFKTLTLEDHFLHKELVSDVQRLSEVLIGEFPNKKQDSHNHGDPDHDYYNDTNSHGFRSPEFNKVELITMGCSQTFGVGVCRNNIWPSKLSGFLGNLSYANLAFPGWSVTRMIDSFYKYVDTYGVPKVAAIYLPDLYRVLVPLGGQNTADSRAQNRDEKYLVLSDATFYIPEIYETSGDVTLPKIAKRPYRLGEVLIPEIAYHQNLSALNVFLSFCEHVGIAVVVSSWDSKVTDLLSSLDYLSDQVYIDVDKILDLQNCDEDHSNFTNLLEHNEFDKGTDVDPVTGAAHMGAHAHMHVAREMANLLEVQLDANR